MVIDSHIHTGKVEYFPSFCEITIAALDKNEIDYAINAPMTALMHGELDTYIEESRERFITSEERIYSYFIFDPRNVKKSISLIEKHVDHKCFIGIKIHPSEHGVNCASTLYRPAWEAAKAYHLPMLTHTWTASATNPKQEYSLPHAFANYLAEFPEVFMIFGHSGGRPEGIREAAAMGKQFKNLYYDTAGDVYSEGFISYMVRMVGAERLLFGSDMNWFEPSSQMGAILGAELSQTQREKILGENARLLFGLPQKNRVKH